MNKFRLSALICVCIVFVAFMRPAQSQSDFVIENVDGRRDVGMGVDAQLTDRLNTVPQRLVLEHVNSIREPAIAALPDPMQNALNQVSIRILLEHVNSKRSLDISSPPAPLVAALEAVMPRFVIEHANARRNIAVAFPRELINDKRPPAITDISAEPSANGVVVRWSTDEFTVGVVHYGRQPGVRPDSVSTRYYAMQHEVVLPAIAPGEQLYYQIVATDLSDNQSASVEQTARGQAYLYLPVIRRR